MTAEPMGIATELAERRERMAQRFGERLSPMARARAFPTVYTAPKADDDMRQEIVRLTAANGVLREENENLRRLAERLQRQLAELRETRDPINVRYKLPTVDILRVVERVTGCPIGVLKGPRRTSGAVMARHLAIWLIAQIRPDLSQPVIGHMMGGKDHTTVRHALHMMTERASDPLVARWLADPLVQAILPRATT